jgi:hypothetical protein
MYNQRKLRAQNNLLLLPPPPQVPGEQGRVSRQRQQQQQQRELAEAETLRKFVQILCWEKDAKICADFILGEGWGYIREE